MADSLNLAGQWELMSQAADPNDAPPEAGVVPDAEIPPTPQPYLLDLGYDLGSPVPVTTTILGDLLDGDRVAGTRTGNRTITLPITITAIDRRTLSMLTDQLIASVNVSTFPLQWWPDGGDPLVWDCYRATCVIEWDQRWEGPLGQPGHQRLVTVTCSAFPFGRSTDLESIDAVATPFVIDAMNASNPNGSTLDTTRSHDGQNSARVEAVFRVSHWGNYYDGSIKRIWNGVGAAPNPKDFTDYKAVTFWVYVDAKDQNQNVSFFLRLTSQNTSATDQYDLLQPALPTQSWRLVSFPVGTRHASHHTGRRPVDYTAISQYELYFRDYRQTWATCGTCTTHSSLLRVNFDTMTGVPSSAIALQTVNGALLDVPGVIGTARAPVALHLTSDVDSSGMLIHRPPPEADSDAVILAPLDTGVAGQRVTVPTAGSGYNGTYTIVLAMQARNASTHEVVVTVNQRITNANTVIATQTVDHVVSDAPVGQPQPYYVVGQITLPLRAIPPDSISSSFTIDVTLNSGDTATDLMLLDTRGQTMIAALPRVVRGLWIDEPDPRFGVGLVLVAAAQDNRAGCYGVMDSVQISGGPFSLDPGDNLILVHSTGGVPDLTATYAPRWMAERSSGEVLEADALPASAGRKSPTFLGPVSLLATFAYPGGVIASAASIAGAVAHMTVSATPGGGISVGGSANIVGGTIAVSLAAAPGSVSTTVSPTVAGVVAATATAAPAGSRTASVTRAGPVAALALAAPAGALAGGLLTSTTLMTSPTLVSSA